MSSYELAERHGLARLTEMASRPLAVSAQHAALGSKRLPVCSARSERAERDRRPLYRRGPSLPSILRDLPTTAGVSREMMRPGRSMASRWSGPLLKWNTRRLAQVALQCKRLRLAVAVRG